MQAFAGSSRLAGARMIREVFGREPELDASGPYLDEVSEARAAWVVSGEAGIGKTVLLEQIVLAAEAREYPVLSCRPAEAETVLSFSALEDLLEPVLDECLPRLDAQRRRALEVALLRGEGAESPVDQRAVSRAALDALRLTAADGPLLLAVDDAQWVDAPSVRVLEFVVRRLDREPVGVLASVRTGGDVATPFGLDRSIAEDRLHRTTVGPLNVAAIQRLLTSRLDLSLPRHLLTRLHQQSGGNPFYALEMARALLHTGVPSGPLDALPIPSNLDDLLSERLARLTRPGRAVVAWVASMPHPTVATLEAVAGDDARDGLPGTVADGVLDLDGDRIRFSHPLLGSVSYAHLEDEDRRRMHAALAAAVSDPEERARHLALAAHGPDEAVAAALDEGARQAAGRGALDAAAELSELAQRATPADRPFDIHRRALATIDHHFGASEMARAAQIAEEALDSCHTGPERAAVLYRIAITRGRLGANADAARLLGEALLEAGDDFRLRAEIEQELSMVTALLSGNFREGTSHARAALRWAERAEDPHLMVSALVWVAGFESFHAGRVRLDLFRRVQSLEDVSGRSSGQQLAFLDLEACWGMVLKWADDFEGGRARLEARYRRALEAGDESILPLVLYHLSELECWSGNWDRAEEYAGDAVRLAREGEQPLVLGSALYSEALVQAHLGRVDRARVAGEEALSLAESMRNLTVAMMAKSVLGFIELSVENYVGSVACLQDLSAELDAMEVREPGVVRFPADAIEALVGVGDLDRAAELVDRLEKLGRAADRPWALATGARCRGLLEAARGDLDAASRSIDRAFVEHKRLGMPFELGRTYLVKGTIERRAKRKRAAKESITRSVNIFEGLGAPLWRDKARAELGRVGVRPAAPLELTPTEERIAELVARGKTSREVADALFISVKTVDSNLTRIYRKLGVRSRTELAARMLGRGDKLAEPGQTPGSS